MCSIYNVQNKGLFTYHVIEKWTISDPPPPPVSEHDHLAYSPPPPLSIMLLSDCDQF